MNAPSSWRGQRTWGFGKAKVKARSKTRNYFGKVFDQTFSKSLWGVGQSPTVCICMREAWIHPAASRRGGN
jgi:hypothetical protein